MEKAYNLEYLRIKIELIIKNIKLCLIDNKIM
jgi:hypothetical protein